jgi:gamma-glutamyltranspeptidase/glutathione hydrolase
MLEPVMTMREGARIYAPAGRLLEPGDLMQQPGLVRAVEILAAEGAASIYRGTIAEALLALVAERDGAIVREDLTEYEAVWADPVEVDYAGTRFLTRGGLSGIPETLSRLPQLRGLDEPQRTLTLLDALAVEQAPETHTTNLVTVDAEGNACVLTTSLGLGSGDWLPGLDLHLNSMHGETDLLVGELRPQERMSSMMAPSLALGGDGRYRHRSRGRTRLRTAWSVLPRQSSTGFSAGRSRPGPDPSGRCDRERRAGRR